MQRLVNMIKAVLVTYKIFLVFWIQYRLYNIHSKEVARNGNVMFVPNVCSVTLSFTSQPVRLRASLDLRTAPVLASHMQLGCTTIVRTHKLVFSFFFIKALGKIDDTKKTRLDQCFKSKQIKCNLHTHNRQSNIQYFLYC